MFHTFIQKVLRRSKYFEEVTKILAINLYETKPSTGARIRGAIPILCHLSSAHCPVSSVCFVFYLLSPVPCPLSPVPCPLSPVPCPLSPVPCPLSPVPCPLSPVPCPLSPVPCPLSPVPCPLSPVPCPLSPVPCPLSPVLYNPSPSPQTPTRGTPLSTCWEGWCRD